MKKNGTSIGNVDLGGEGGRVKEKIDSKQIPQWINEWINEWKIRVENIEIEIFKLLEMVA